MKRVSIIAFVSLFIASCASHTDEIAAAYVSPIQYQDYSCKQVGAEMGRVSRRAQEVAYNVNKNADGDATATAVGVILFWPALFFIDGDSPQAQEYARLKGEFDALEQAGIAKECGLAVQEDPFVKIEQERRAQQQQHQSQSGSNI